MILSSFREIDHKLYVKQFKLILTGKRIFFHIKHLLISFLSVLENPSPDEQGLLVRYILPDKFFSKVFYQHVFVDQVGIQYLIDKNLLVIAKEKKVITKNSFLKKLILTVAKYSSRGSHKSKEVDMALCFQLLRRNLNTNVDVVLDYLLKVTDKNFVFQYYIF